MTQNLGDIAKDAAILIAQNPFGDRCKIIASMAFMFEKLTGLKGATFIQMVYEHLTPAGELRQ